MTPIVSGMDLEDYLETTKLIDCHGRISHTLTLLLDGTVRVRTPNLAAVVDPRDRSVRPSAVRLGSGEYGHEQIVQIACDMSIGQS